MKKILILSTLLVILNNCAFFEQFNGSHANCKYIGDGYCIDVLSGEKYKW